MATVSRVSIIIRTRHVPATDTCGSRILARGAGRSLRIPYPYEAHDAHEVAALALAKRIAARLPGPVEVKRGERDMEWIATF